MTELKTILAIAVILQIILFSVGGLMLQKYLSVETLKIKKEDLMLEERKLTLLSSQLNETISTEKARYLELKKIIGDNSKPIQDINIPKLPTVVIPPVVTRAS
jgi:hypothetical protein